MDHRGDKRPPRSARPGRSQSPARESKPYSVRPPIQTFEGSKGNVSFQHTERGDRQAPLDTPRTQRTMPSAYQNQYSPGLDPESADFLDSGRVGRKKSLVKPDREKIEPGHRQWHYRSHVAQLEEEGQRRMGVMPSSTS